METEDAENRPVESASIQYLVETIKQLQEEVESLSLELRKPRVPSGKIGIMFVVPGVLSLIFSVLSNSQVLAFIGLGLTFWGALFFFANPVRYVKSSLLDSSIVSSYFTIDRIIRDLKYEGKSYYIPPFPEGVYLPEHLRGLKDMIVFISADSGAEMPSIDEIAKSMFLLKNPKGICVVPPGSGLLTQFEKEVGRDITKLELSDLYAKIHELVLENFQLAKGVEIKPEENQVHVRIIDSIYKDLYRPERKLKSVHFLGCPLVSAIACAIAKSTGKIVSIGEDKVTVDGRIIEVTYRFIGD